MFEGVDKISCKPERPDNMRILNPFKKRIKCNSVSLDWFRGQMSLCRRQFTMCENFAPGEDQKPGQNMWWIWKGRAIMQASENWWLVCVIFAIRLFTRTERGGDTSSLANRSFSQTHFNHQHSLCFFNAKILGNFCVSLWLAFVIKSVHTCSYPKYHSETHGWWYKECVILTSQTHFTLHASQQSKGIIKKFHRQCRNYQNCSNCNDLFSNVSDKMAICLQMFGFPCCTDRSNLILSVLFYFLPRQLACKW